MLEKGPWWEVTASRQGLGQGKESREMPLGPEVSCAAGPAERSHRNPKGERGNHAEAHLCPFSVPLGCYTGCSPSFISPSSPEAVSTLR